MPEKNNMTDENCDTGVEIVSGVADGEMIRNKGFDEIQILAENYMNAARGMK